MNAAADFLYSPSAVRAIDAFAIDVLGTAGRELMERAGRAAYAALRERWPQARALRIVCGIGNNAGDGFVLARLALADGLDAQVLQLGDARRLQGAAQAVAADYTAAGGTSVAFSAAALEAAEVVVDAIFGTGLDRPVRGEWAAAIAAINAAGRPVLALDICSGIHGGTGAVLGDAVRAELTVSFIGLKAGLFTGAGPAYSGDVHLDDLNMPGQAYGAAAPCARLSGSRQVADALPARRRDAHKGHFGHVLVVGGDHGFGGAARMAAEAAGRVGAGLVSVATRGEHVPALLAARPESMVMAVAGALDLQPLLERASVVVIGPGLGLDAWGRALFERVLDFEGPLVVDADGLNLLAQAPHRRGNWVLTPHPGEAGRLLGTSAAKVQAQRFDAAARLVARYGGTIILKGAGTIVAAEEQLPRVCPAGNPGMASGGMGDVLSGVLGGLLAQGLAPFQAAAVGVHVHAQAADLAAREGERGMLALDLMPHLRALVNP
jgi:hydroxyethylthiazole kinase-like uncharacterized protein yjeF